MATVSIGRQLVGPYGTAVECLVTLEPTDPAAWQASIATWILHCPNQSPAWEHYRLNAMHLRPIEGESQSAHIQFPGATHEILLFALDPLYEPDPLSMHTWKSLTPFNVVEQVQLPTDELCKLLVDDCVKAVLHGLLPAEPMLSGAIEPWHTSLIRSSAHLRGEEHAP